MNHIPPLIPVRPTTMKIFLVLISLLAAPLAAVANDAAPNAAPAHAKNAVELWIAVQLPKNTNPTWIGDDLATRFSDQVASALRIQGYQGHLGTLHPGEPAPSGASVLVIKLNSWKAKDGIGDCSFNASLRTGGGERNLGLFVGDNFVVTADGEHRFSSDGLAGSALEALDNIFARVHGAGLLKSG